MESSQITSESHIKRKYSRHQTANCLKQAIHISSKMEFLEHGKEKAIVKAEKPMKFRTKDSTRWNSNSKTSCADSILRPRCAASGTSKNLPRLRPRDDSRKSEIRRV
ncbi:hypothetical protein AVEN_62247-1 [Araneus ventricosus]|uniref:Uncharacterized protein n=1 Tax=Araneus ventricosus TaxID=182803 RepID=A0A4Y2EB16_ARAVE|nr:hypothetical protein AVEN_62247-1 [Araneus ventricosus]